MGFVLTLLVTAYIVYGFTLSLRSHTYWAGRAIEKCGDSDRQTKLAYVRRNAALTTLTWPVHRGGIVNQRRKELGR